MIYRQTSNRYIPRLNIDSDVPSSIRFRFTSFRLTLHFFLLHSVNIILIQMLLIFLKNEQ